MIALAQEGISVPANDPVENKTDLGMAVDNSLTDLIIRCCSSYNQVSQLDLRLHAVSCDHDVGYLSANGNWRKQDPQENREGQEDQDGPEVLP